ncbi:glycoside hydrolase family 38 C-terminal domain-containing protein [Phytoactinopolyspora limicola]|uniref:glycoside hydrolase family 38 N-terminal domain-containing protein n=1 Tax=Phytoactinopolyspora limicola TaxID=2715536 RepID=UPI001407E3FA|nr:glycoside hydrolase family 38 C-terminal domain-containing protein [Phytoactinopolyspora limicola]
MHHDRSLIENRVERVLKQRLHPAIHRTVAPLAVSAWQVDGGRGEPVDPAVALPGAGHLTPPGLTPVEYVPAQVGDRWGPPWGTAWFHVRGEVPTAAAGRRIELVIDLGWADHSPGFQAEGLVYRPDGSVVKGLNPRNVWVPIADVAAGGESIDLYVEAAANPLILEIDPFRPTRLGEKATAGDEPLYRLARADVCVLERDVWELVQDIEVLDGLMRQLSDGEPRRWDIERALERALDILDLQDIPGTAAAARGTLEDVLASPASASAHRLSAVGHAHIDSAWLWPVRETVRKVARTSSNVAQLLDEYPDMVFAMSSAQQMEWIERHRPEVFTRVAEHVRGGRFVPVGGMWVESDTNMPGSEAMARQFVYGKRYFLEKFGIETEEVWLPDSFGYSPALPQLVKLSGSRWFLTQKISWNQVNPFPHHSFWWEGIDGTRVFTHFPPVDTYNSELSGRELAHAVSNFRDKGGATRSLVPFGWGDGGGGPTREMVARARRTADLEGSPRVVIEKPATFFAAAEDEYADAPVWAGELYLELHRGTYTSQAKTKHGNRRSEHLLAEAELWSATAAIRGLGDYPYDALERIWKLVLLNQFHDILPGSSIAWVHREAAETYTQVAAELKEIIGAAQTALAGGADESGSTVVFNAAPHDRSGVPAFGAAPRGASADQVRAEPLDGGYVLDNGRLRVTVDGHGLLTSVRDLDAGREVLAPGQAANLLQIHPDFPNMWDAWDVDRFYRNTVTDLVDADQVSVVASGDDGAATVRVDRVFGDSSAVQTITLAPGARRLDLTVDVDWHEREKFLKVAFPLDVHSRHASYETQFGHHDRPTHENTSWEAMKFEVCAHRFVHVAEPGYGVALVNDSTYGHDVRREARAGGGTSTTVRLSLLRAPRFPDPETDQGRHVLAYALVPGADLADAVREGAAINLPERVVPGHRAVAPAVRVASGTAVITAVKLADDRSGDVVVRLYEATGGRSVARLTTGFPVAEVAETDLLERPVEPLALLGDADDDGERDGGSGDVTLNLRPFQVVTLRFRPASTPDPQGTQ